MSDGQTVYRGRMDRNVDGTITARIFDQWGWEIVITGVRDPDNGGYVLTGVLGDPPPGLRVPAIDGEEEG